MSMTSVQCHITSMTFKSGKHSTVLCTQLFSLHKRGITNENNRSYLKNNNIGTLGRILGQFFKNCRIE